MNALNAALFTSLTGGTALSSLVGSAIYYQAAPDGAALPYAVFNYQGGGPLNITRSDLRDLLVYARGYANAPALAGSIDSEISALLHQRTLTIAGYNNYWTARERDVSLVETTAAGERIFTEGGIYRIRIDD